MTTEEYKNKLKEEGFVHIYEWTDEPGTAYAKHAHQDKVAMFILFGGLTFQFPDQEKALVAGDRFDVPPALEHTALVGPEGCVYVVGEVIEGDS